MSKSENTEIVKLNKNQGCVSWGWCCLTFLRETGHGAKLGNDTKLCGKGSHPEGSGQAAEVALGQPAEVQQDNCKDLHLEVQEDLTILISGQNRGVSICSSF